MPDELEHLILEEKQQMATEHGWDGPDIVFDNWRDDPRMVSIVLDNMLQIPVPPDQKSKRRVRRIINDLRQRMGR